MGIGAGIAFPALFGVAMSDATPSDAGLISGLINTTAQVGGALGLAVLATLSSSRSTSLLDDGKAENVALNSGYNLAYAIAAGCVVVGVAIGITMLKPKGHVRQEAEGHEMALAQD
jgi:hypothetical protein